MKHSYILPWSVSCFEPRALMGNFDQSIGGRNSCYGSKLVIIYFTNQAILNSLHNKGLENFGSNRS